MDEMIEAIRAGVALIVGGVIFSMFASALKTNPSPLDLELWGSLLVFFGIVVVALGVAGLVLVLLPEV